MSDVEIVKHEKYSITMEQKRDSEGQEIGEAIHEVLKVIGQYIENFNYNQGLIFLSDLESCIGEAVKNPDYAVNHIS